MFPRPQPVPDQARVNGTAVYPMQPYNGQVIRKPDRNAGTDDYDLTPRQFRRYVSTGAQDVQLNCGTQRGLRNGYRWPYRGAGWYFAAAPVIPGQTRGNYGGFIPTGPDPYSMQTIPGQQPINPNGPFKGAANAQQQYVSPGTG